MNRILCLGAVLACLLLAACSDDNPVKPQYDYLLVPGEFATIQMAVDSATTGDTILIAPGTYTGEGNVGIRISYKSIILKGDAGGRTIIDCEHTAKFATVKGTETSGPEFINLTIKNGSAHSGQPYSNHAGGALYCSACEPIFRNCRFIDCHADNGGAVVLSDINTNRTTGLFVSCEFEADSAVTGGALTVSRADVTLVDCKFENNNSPYAGGAVHLTYGNLSLQGCLFAGNIGAYGADIFVFESDVEMESCTMYQGQGGGSLYLDGGKVTVDRSLIVGSTAAIAGEGTRVPEFTCSVLWQNLSGDWVGDIADQLGVNGNFSADPKFIDPAAGDFFIHHDSPCAAHANECGALIGAFPVGDIVESH